MGQKSDEEILAGLAELKSGRETDETPDELPGVGESMPDEDSEAPESDEEAEEDEEVEGEEEGAEEAEEADSEEPEEEDDDDAEEVEAKDQTEEADKEIARIQEAEKEAKQRINEKLEELTAKDTEIAERLAKAEELEATHEKRSKRIRQAPIALAKSLGLENHQDFIDLGAKLYKYGKATSPDAKPELKAWAQGVERDGEQDTSVDELRAEVRALTEARDAEKKQKEEEAEAAQQQAEAAAELNTFADSVIEGCSDEYPIAAKMIGDMGEEEARTSITNLALHLFQGSGAAPTPKDIFEAVEEVERSRLQSLGLDPDELFPRSKNKDKPGKASKEKKAPMKSKTKKKPQAKTDEEILAKLKERREARQNV